MEKLEGEGGDEIGRERGERGDGVDHGGKLWINVMADHTNMSL